MNAYAIGSLVGALVVTLLISRLFALAFRRVKGIVKPVAPNVATFVIGTILGGFGFANGGAPRFLYSAGLYILPVAVWTIVDLLRWRGARQKEEFAPVESGSTNA